MLIYIQMNVNIIMYICTIKLMAEVNLKVYYKDQIEILTLT